MPRQAIIYLRKSMLRDADNDLDMHRARCLAKARERGEADPLVIQEEEGHRSAYSDKRRPGFLEVHRLIGEDRVSVLFVNDRARVWRNAVEWLVFLTFCHKHGTEIIPAIEAPVGDVSDPAQQLLEFINGWKNEQYRTNVSNTLRALKQDFRAAGLPAANKLRFGLKLEGKKMARRAVPSEDFGTVVELLELYVAGNGSDRIARTLRARGRTWARSPTRRTPIVGASVLGVINHVEQYRAFLEPLLYEQVLALRSRRADRQQNGARLKHPRRLLYLTLYCAKCGARYHSNHHPPRPTNPLGYDSYLHPPQVVCDAPVRWVPAAVVDAQVWDQLDRLQSFFRERASEIEALILTQADEQSQVLDHALRRERLAQELLTLRKNYNRGDFGDTDDPAVQAYFREEQSRLQKELRAVPELPAPVPHKELDLAALARFRDAPLAEVRAAAALDPEAGNEWLRSIVERVEIWGRAARVVLYGELAKYVGDSES